MTAPVNRKFLEEFEEKEKKSKSCCLGLLRGRKVKHPTKEIELHKLVRSRALDDVRISHNPIFTVGRENA